MQRRDFEETEKLDLQSLSAVVKMLDVQVRERDAE
jgi:hypothetical protein